MIPVDPQQAAQTALALIGKTTTVTVDNSAVVAGRAAYELILSPKGDGSLISSVRIAVDGTTHVPLRVEVDSAKTTLPAFSVGFTSVDFGTPDDAEFNFTPPPGTTVNGDDTAAAGVLHGLPNLAEPTVVGSGWTSVVVADQSPAGATPKPGPGPDVHLHAVGAPAPPVSPTSASVHRAGTAVRRSQASRLPVGGRRRQPGQHARPARRALPQESGAWGTGRVLTGTLFTW